MTIDELNKILSIQSETEVIEFKKFENHQISIAGKKDKNRKSLFGYCVAIGNEGGGKLILGVEDKINLKIGRREVVGTNAIQNITEAKSKIFRLLRCRIEIEEVVTLEGKVQIVHIPSRPIAYAFSFYGMYLMRNGEELTEMDQQTLKNILNEVEPDFTRQSVSGLSLKELDKGALDVFKKMWAQKSNREDFLKYPNEKILQSVGLLDDDGFKYASLILFGTESALIKHLPDAEIIYEWRQDSAKVNYDYRKTWKIGFFSVFEDIWKTINDRNIRIPFQEGLIQREVLAFSEKPIREAILNAVAHRDYSIKGGSIFIKASSENFRIESPGGFPDGVTQENILHKTFWRNRVIAEVFEKANLVERSGQGVDDIFNFTIEEGKGSPNYSESDSQSVTLDIPAQVKDKQFVLYLEKVANNKQITFSTEELLELEKIRSSDGLSKIKFKDKFLGLGIVERVGKTSGSRYILSHDYYQYEKKPGNYTRIRGISRDKCKELILKHIKTNKKKTMTNHFYDTFPELKPKDISNILQELKRDNKIKFTGTSKCGYWEVVN